MFRLRGEGFVFRFRGEGLVLRFRGDGLVFKVHLVVRGHNALESVPETFSLCERGRGHPDP